MIELLPKPYVKPDGMSETMSQEFARVGITQSKVFFGWCCMQSRLDVKQVRILFNRQKTAFRKKQRLGFNIARQKVHISQQPFRPHQKKNRLHQYLFTILPAKRRCYSPCESV